MGSLASQRAEDRGDQRFQARRRLSSEAISRGRHLWADWNRRTPVVSGVVEDKGRLWTPAASMSFGAWAWSSGSDCVK